MIVCPLARNKEPILIDLVKIKQMESRISEIAFVTPQKAPELLTTFILAHADLSDFIASLEYERFVADRDARQRKSIVILDEMPSILEKRGLVNAKSPSGNSELRTAVLELDNSYQNSMEIVERLEAVISFLKNKRDSFEMGYHSVKRIIEKLRPELSRHINIEENDRAEVGEERVSNQFGKPRY